MNQIHAIIIFCLLACTISSSGAVEGGGGSQDAGKSGVLEEREGRTPSPARGRGNRGLLVEHSTFAYSPSGRDPFISYLSPETIVTLVATPAVGKNEMARQFAELLASSFGERIIVSGVSISSGSPSKALVLYNEWPSSDGQTIPPLPPKSVTVEEGLPMRFSEADMDMIGTLMRENVNAPKGLRLKRDMRNMTVNLPVSKITPKGIHIALPWDEEEHFVPIYRDLETYTGAGE